MMSKKTNRKQGASGIFLGFGSNLPGEDGAVPAENIIRGFQLLKAGGIVIREVSPFYESEPVPPSGQPWFLNGAARIETELEAEKVLEKFLETEEELGRIRGKKNEARILDLDLLAWNDRVLPDPGAWKKAAKGKPVHGLVCPHPRLHVRRFVLGPLNDIAPGWVHPVLGKTPKEFLKNLETAGKIRKLQVGGTADI